jgi:hypothetical protein
MNHQAFVLYDVEQIDPKAGLRTGLIARAKRVSVNGEILGWRVGEFQTDLGKSIYGIRIRYLDSLLMIRGSQYIEVPNNAQNVRLVMGDLPERYEEALKVTA